jgi:two-component system response regulator YesN
MGETFINYVVNLKMNEAKKLLKNSSFKIYEISEKLGYKDVNYFSKNFKRIFNVTPSEYRELA